MSDYLALLGLALVDSMSVGTLAVPLVLIITWRRMRPAHYATYLLSISGAYFLIGLALFFGLGWIIEVGGGIARTDWFGWVLLALGLALAALGILSPTPKKRTPEEVVAAQTRSMKTDAGSRARAGLLGMVALAMGAAVIEAATMVPYLAALGIIQATGTPLIVQIVTLAIYCLVMTLPAVVLGVLVQLHGQKILPKILKALPRLEYEAKVTLLWVAALVGVYLIGRGAAQVGLVG